MFFSSLFSKSKTDVAGDKSLRLFCDNCKSFTDDLSIRYCPVCGWWGGKKGHTIRKMTPREEQGYFLDEALIRKYDEDDKNYGYDLNTYFDSLESAFSCPQSYPDEIKQLGDEYKKSLADYIQSLRNYVIKPTYYDVCVELDNRRIAFNIQIDKLYDKYGLTKLSFQKLKRNDSICSITMWNRDPDIAEWSS